MIVGARQSFNALHSLEFFLRMVPKTKTSSEQQICERKHLVDERGQRRMDGLVGSWKKGFSGSDNYSLPVWLKTSLNAQHHEPWGRRPGQVPILSTKNRDLRLQFTQAHQNWTTECWKNSLVCWIWIPAESPNLPCVNSPGWWWWCNGGGNVFLAVYGPLNTSQSWFESHGLYEYCCWPCASIYGPLFTKLLMAPSSRIMHHLSSKSCVKLVLWTRQRAAFSGLPTHQIWIQ